MECDNVFKEILDKAMILINYIQRFKASSESDGRLLKQIFALGARVCTMLINFSNNKKYVSSFLIPAPIIIMSYSFFISAFLTTCSAFFPVSVRQDIDWSPGFSIADTCRLIP